MNLDTLQSLLNKSQITVKGFSAHNKASELYVEVVFMFENRQVWEGVIPYHYRRTGLFVENEEDLAVYALFRTTKSKRMD